MRRFERKGSHNKTQQDLAHRKQRTQANQLNDSSSQSTTKNISLDDLSIDRKLFYPTPSAHLIYSLLKSKLTYNLYHAFEKLKKNVQYSQARDRSVSKIVSKGSTIVNKLKSDGFCKIKQQKSKFNAKVKGLGVLHRCFTAIDKRTKRESFMKVNNCARISIVEQNSHLKQIQTKYNQNYVPEQFAKEFRKFLKINPKNGKIFLKSTQEIIQPCLQQLNQSLQSRRVRKNTPSDTQVLTKLLINYIFFLHDSNEKLSITQAQLKQLTNERDQAVSQLKNIQKQQDNRVKDLKKLDSELIQKTENLIESSFNVNSLKNIERAIEYQIKISDSRGGQKNYEFSSRVITLKAALTILKKLFVNLNIPETPSLPLSSSRSKPQIPVIRKRSDIIEQQNCLQQSDIFDEINSITDELLQSMKSETTVEALKYCGNEKKFLTTGFKHTHIPELAKIHAKFQEILKLYSEKMFECLQLQGQNIELKQYFKVQNQKITSQISLKNTQIRSLSEKISQLQQKLRVSQLKNLQLRIESQKSCQQLQDTIESLLCKLEKALDEIEDKNAQIQKINTKIKQRQKKISLMQDQFKKFKKMFKSVPEQKKERDKNIEQILERSLSKSRSNASKQYQKLKNVASPKNSIHKPKISLGSSSVSQSYSVKPHNNTLAYNLLSTKMKNMPAGTDIDEFGTIDDELNKYKQEKTQIGEKAWDTNSSDGRNILKTPRRQGRTESKVSQLSRTVKNSQVI